MRINGATLEVVRASVLEARADAIVNAANSKMRGGGGVDGAIHRAAGSGLLEELRRVCPRGAATAQVVATSGHKLPQKLILHVAGPIYRNYAPEEAARLLALCYRGCLEEADKRGLESVAFPSISTGAYGYPLQQAAPLALESVCKYLREHPNSSLKLVQLSMFASEEFQVFTSELEALEASPEPGDSHMQSWQSAG